MTVKHCAEHEQLQSRVLEILEKITAIAGAQLRAFKENDKAAFAALDKATEEAIGEKERRIGALRQHDIDHRCQSDHL